MKPPATSGARVPHGQSRRPVGSTRTTDAAPSKRPKRARGKSAVAQRARPGTATTRARDRADMAESRRRAMANEVEFYDGPALDGEIRAYRGAAGSRRGPTRASAAPASDTAESRFAETKQQSLRAYGSAPRGTVARAQTSRRTAPPRTIVGSGGAAALTVGKAMVDVARPAAAAAGPMLRLVAGGLDRLPTGSVAQPAARGRILIVIAGLLAAGLIYVNVAKLEAGDGYARYSQRAQELQRENTILRARIAGLDSAERIVKFATKRLNMVMPVPEQFEYVRARDGDAVRAMRTYTPPTITSPTPQPTAPTGQGGPSIDHPALDGTPPAAIEPQTPATGSPSPATPGQATPGQTTPGQTTPAPAEPGAANGDVGATAPGGH